MTRKFGPQETIDFLERARAKVKGPRVALNPASEQEFLTYNKHLIPETILDERIPERLVLLITPVGVYHLVLMDTSEEETSDLKRWIGDNEEILLEYFRKEQERFDRLDREVERIEQGYREKRSGDNG